MPRSRGNRHWEEYVISQSDLGLMLHRLTLQKAATSDQLPDHHPESVDVRRGSPRSLVRHLRSDVAWLRIDDTRHCAAATIFTACCSKVDQLHITAITQHDVLGAEVAMRDLQRATRRILAV